MIWLPQTWQEFGFAAGCIVFGASIAIYRIRADSKYRQFGTWRSVIILTGLLWSSTIAWTAIWVGILYIMGAL